MDNTIAERLQILETLNRYAWSYDTRDLDLMRDCFAENGSFEIVLDGQDGWGPYQGRETIVEWLASIMESQTDQRRHCVTNLVFRELVKESAKVDSYLVLTAVENNALNVICTGTYHDSLIIEKDRWVIQSKILNLDNPF